MPDTNIDFDLFVKAGKRGTLLQSGRNHFPKGRPGATNGLNPLSPSGMSVEAAHCKYDTPPQDYWWSPARVRL